MKIAFGIFIGMVLAISMFWRPNEINLRACLHEVLNLYGDTCAGADVDQRAHCVLDWVEACLK